MSQANRSSHFSLFTGLLIFILFLSACGPSGTPVTSGDNDTPQQGGTWIDDLQNEPDSLLPNGSVQNFSYMIMNALYAPLFAGDETGKINAALATEIPTLANGRVSADAKVWRITLRSGLQWSDGQPITAEDVDFTWKLWNNPAFGAKNTTIVKLIDHTEISADNLSITFYLKSPFAPFITMWTDGVNAPMPKHHYGSVDPAQIIHTADNLKPSIASGPFTMTESTPGTRYTVQRNPKYYQADKGLPHLDTIIFRPVNKQDVILSDLQAGSIHSAWFLDAAKIPSYKNLTNYELLTTLSASYEAIHFNQGKDGNPALQDVAVRKAISLAIDHETLIRDARQQAAEALCTDHTKAYTPGYQADAKCPVFDLNAANKVLDEAGWVMGSDNVRTKNGMRLEFNYATVAGIQWREQDLQINQANFQKIGIKTNLQRIQSSAFFSTFLVNKSGEHYDLAEWGSSYTYDAHDAVNFSCDQIGKSNFNYACIPELDQLFTQEQALADPQARQQIFNQIHDLMLEKLPVVTLYALQDIEIHKKGTHNYKPGPFGATETVKIAEWWCDKGVC